MTEERTNQDIYARPRVVDDLNDCYFYHTMDIPGYGTVKGEWDLRGNEKEYLGGVSFQDKRVLEVGTANGFLCFYMESQGAEVVACDVSEEQSWDTLRLAKYSAKEFEQMIQERKRTIRRLNNGFWLAHRANASRSRVVYTAAYDIPQEIGPVDISTFSAVLLHLRDPFLALQKALSLTRETVIITENLGSKRMRVASAILRLMGKNSPFMWFQHDYKNPGPLENWWGLSPDILVNMIGALGFERCQVHQWGGGKDNQHGMPAAVPSVTIVGHRTRGSVARVD